MREGMMAGDSRSYSEEEYRVVARAHFEETLASKQEANRTQADYGRWLIAQMFIANAGALVLLGSVDKPERFSDAAGWFISGLALSFVCGFLAWVNFQIATVAYNSAAHPFMLVDRIHYPSEATIAEHAKWLRRTSYAAIVAGIASVTALVIGGLVAIP